MDPFVIVVEDDEDVALLVRLLLEHMVLTPAIWLTGAQALRADKVWKTATCAIVDLNMPEVTGVDVLRYLAKRWPHVRRVVLSGSALPDAEVDELAQARLGKPFKASELLVAAGLHLPS